MNEELNLSREGLALTRTLTGCREEVAPGHFRAHENEAGELSIGWGHVDGRGRKFQAGDIWTTADCERVLLYDLSAATDLVRQLTSVKLRQRQFDALVVYAHLAGEEALTGSRLIARLNTRDLTGAVEELKRQGQPELAEFFLSGILPQERAPEAASLHPPSNPRRPQTEREETGFEA